MTSLFNMISLFQKSSTSRKKIGRIQLSWFLLLCFFQGSLLSGAERLQSDHAVLQAVPVTGKVRIDGNLDDFNKRGVMIVWPALKIRNRYRVEVSSMWDRNALYLGMHFSDPTPLINNVDPESATYDGWQSDAFQGRFTTDYGQIHFDAWYSSKKESSLAVLSYDAPVNRNHSRVFRGKGQTINDPDGFQMAFRQDADQRGYVQEIRVPWKLLYRKVPDIQGGHELRFTGEFFWGGPTGIKWPKVMWADPINPKAPVRINVYKSPHTWGRLKLLSDQKEALGDVLETGDDVRRLQGPLPIRLSLPKEAVRFSLVINDADGKRIRNLASHAFVTDYLVRKSETEQIIEVPWDGRSEGGWNKSRMRFLGDFVSEGDYQVRVLVHSGVGVKHAGSFFNPGTPPWPTADGKGSWLSDHAHASVIAAMPRTATSGGRLFLMAPHAESGVPFIGLDMAGKKLWQWVRGSTHLNAIATDEKNLWLGFNYAGKPMLAKLDPQNGTQVKFASGTEDLPLPADVIAMTTLEGKLVCAFRSDRQSDSQLHVLDTSSGKVIRKLRVPKLHSLTASGKHLLGLTEQGIVQIDPVSGESHSLTFPGIPTPSAFTTDTQGRIYVSDSVTETVAIYDSSSNPLRKMATIGKPGGHRPGKFDPLQMTTPRALCVEDRSDGRRRLWCIENDSRLRRVSVWDVTNVSQPAYVRDYIGGTGYMGSGGLLSDDVPNLGIYRGAMFQIDYENDRYTPRELMGGRPDSVEGMTNLFGIGRFDRSGFGNGFHFISDVSGKNIEYYIEGMGLPMVFVRRNGRWQCVAALGSIHHHVPFPAHFPKPMNGENVFCWNDLNRDGYQQADELTWRKFGGVKPMLHKMWSYRSDRNLVWYHSGYRFQPVRFTEDGAPVYDLKQVRKLPGELGERAELVDIYRTRSGYVLCARKPGDRDTHGTIHGLMQLEGYDETGTLRWTYPTYWFSVHGGFTAPMAMPGVIMGMLKITNIVSMPDHDIISLHGNTGQEFLIRDDGFYIGELFTDQRMAPEELPSEEKIAGVPINDTTMGGEPFSGWISRQQDGKVRLSYGLNDVRIAEVTGLESVRLLPSQQLKVTAADLLKAKHFVPDSQKKMDRGEIVIAQGSGFDAANETFHDAVSIRSGRKEIGQVKLRYDDRNLYAIWKVFDLTPLVNRGTEIPLAFKSGDSVSLFVASDEKYETGQQGGTRLLLTQLKAKPTCVLYRPTGPGNAPFTFESPVRKSRFQYVAENTKVKMKIHRQSQFYVVSAEIPWKALNLRFREGMTLRGDLGVIFGKGSTNAIERIVRWKDQQTNVVNDTPTEAEFFPARWGTFQLGSVAGSTATNTGTPTPTTDSHQQNKNGWKTVYVQNFDDLPKGLKTTEGVLSNWDGGAGSGLVREGGKGSSSGKYLAANSPWGLFNFGPVVNLDLSAHPHTKVRVSFDLYTFGNWRGNQLPAHRLGFWDHKATHPQARYFTFATVKGQKQSWPDDESRHQEHPAATGAVSDDKIDLAPTHTNDHRWKYHVEYVSGSSLFRFGMLGGMRDLGSAPRIPFPYYGIDNMRVEVWNPEPLSGNRTKQKESALPKEYKSRLIRGDGSALIPIRFQLETPGYVTLVIEDSQGRRVKNLIAETWFPAGEHVIGWDGHDETSKNFRICGVYDIDPQLVSVGTYRVRGLVRDRIELRYVMSVNNAGDPPWPNRKATGRWLADHSPPTGVLFLPAGRVDHLGESRNNQVYSSSSQLIPSDQPLMMITSLVAESGDGIVFTDLLGKKIRGVKTFGSGGGWCGAQFVARDIGRSVDRSYAYLGVGWKNGIDVRSLPKNEVVFQKSFPLENITLGGLAVRNGLMAVTIPQANSLILFDLQNRKELARLKLDSPRGVAFDHEGSLLVLSQKELLRLQIPPHSELERRSETLSEWDSQRLVTRGLEDPQQLTLDASHQIYISDRGNSHQVKVFSQKGVFLRSIGEAGGAQTGTFLPHRMRNPAGITIDSRKRLWVAEASLTPKRISVWSAEGKFLHAFYGPPGYGGGGTLDPEDKTRFYLSYGGGLEFQLDWKQPEASPVPNRTTEGFRIRPFRPINTYWLPGQLKMGHDWHPAPQTPIYLKNRQYMTNGFSNSPGGFGNVVGIWLMQEGRAVPVAAAGTVSRWKPLLDQTFQEHRLQQGDLDNPFFVWSDRNGDAKPQPEEVIYAKDDGVQHSNRKEAGQIYVGKDLSFTTSFGLHLKPSGFSRKGVPLYEAGQIQRLVKKMTYHWIAYEAVFDDEWFIAKAEPMRGFRKGKLMWTYPNRWPELHACLREPPPHPGPGQMIGTTRFLGHPVRPLGSEAGNIWALTGYYGRIHLITSDGLYVGSLFRDARVRGYFRAFDNLGDARSGMLMNDCSLQTECFFDTITQTRDGKIYLQCGKSQCNLVRVDGLESIRRLPVTNVNVSENQLQTLRK